MRATKQRRLAWLSIIVAAGLAVSACGGDFDRTDTIFSNPGDERTENYITGRFG